MNRAIHSAVVACLLFAFVGCRGDATLTKEIVGTWSWKPREMLPSDQIRDRGFATPTLEAAQFTAEGRYVFVQQIPGYDTSVAGTPVAVPEEWREWKGSWSIEDGELAMVPGSKEDRWLAKRRPDGWVTESNPVDWERSFKVVALDGQALQLETLAIGDFDRNLRRVPAMPARPTPVE